MDVYYHIKDLSGKANSHVRPNACAHPNNVSYEDNCKQCYDGKIDDTKTLSSELHGVSNSSGVLNAGLPRPPGFIFTKKRTKREPIELKSHIKVIAGNPPIYKCDICKKSFKTKAHVHYHDFCLGKDRPLQCDVCGAGFITKAHLKYHLSTHTGECSFVCNECGESFNHRGKLLKHICHSGVRNEGFMSIAGIPCNNGPIYDPQQTPSTSGTYPDTTRRDNAVAQELEARLQSLRSYMESQEKIQAVKLKTAEIELAIAEQQRKHNEELFALERKNKEELFALDKKIKEQQLRKLHV